MLTTVNKIVILLGPRYDLGKLSQHSWRDYDRLALGLMLQNRTELTGHNVVREARAGQGGGLAGEGNSVVQGPERLLPAERAWEQFS